ncbi:MAG: PTD012 family protein [Hyphomicrobiales bacterium]|nr:PTD012 family protein [Hyphomicrobiales bacterium]
MTSTLEIKEGTFFVPDLDAIAETIEHHLRDVFAEVSVSVATCPDLTTIGCAQVGLGGSPALIEIGGEPYVHNPLYRAEGSFDLRAIAETADLAGCKLIGAGFPSLTETAGKCGELMPCEDLDGVRLSKLAWVGASGEPRLEDYRSSQHGGLGNLYACRGLTGDVVRIVVRKRTGEEASFTQAIRSALVGLTADGTRHIGLGGVFRVLEGKVRAHISPDFECIPFPYYDTEKNQVTRPDFLRFYDDMGPDLTCLSVLWTGDPSGGQLHLRPTGEHTHFFNTVGRQEGGHYHFDTTPESISYEGYFHPAERVVRVNDIYARLAS